jgi:hypothetical protein
MSHFGTAIAGYVMYTNSFHLNLFWKKVKGVNRGVGGWVVWGHLNFLDMVCQNNFSAPPPWASRWESKQALA